MPEANHPQNQNSPKLPDSMGASADLSHFTDVVAFPTKASEDDWETVDFPNAISVDALSPTEVPGDAVSSDISLENHSPDLIPPETTALEDSGAGTPFNPFNPVDHRETSSFNTANWIQGPSFVIHRHPSENFPESAHQTHPQDPETLTDPQETYSSSRSKHNQDLTDRVVELEIALAHCQKTLQEQETLIHQQTQDLKTAQKQVTRLFSKLELAHQILQQQEVMAESLKSQWHQSQLRLAEMERECALTQQRYNDSCHQLMLSENMCRELRSRLHRQQRHTLQFKTALERCLEMTVGKDMRDNQNHFTNPLPTLNSDLLNSSLHTSPVRPWSAPPESSTETDPALPHTTSEQEEWAKELIQKLEQLGHFNTSHSKSTASELPTENNPSVPPAIPNTPPPVFPHLQTYWHIASEYPPVPETPSDQTETTSTPSPADHLRPDFATLDQTPETEESFTDAPTSTDAVIDEDADIPEANLEEHWHDGHQWQVKPETPNLNPSSNWPAPLVYPQRPLKKPPSLAAIQLPSFS